MLQSPLSAPSLFLSPSLQPALMALPLVLASFHFPIVLPVTQLRFRHQHPRLAHGPSGPCSLPRFPQEILLMKLFLSPHSEAFGATCLLGKVQSPRSCVCSFKAESCSLNLFRESTLSPPVRWPDSVSSPRPDGYSYFFLLLPVRKTSQPSCTAPTPR